MGPDSVDAESAIEERYGWKDNSQGVFQEDGDSEPLRAAVVEIENNFYSYKAHGHKPSQYPKVICWDAPASGRKDRLNPVRNKKYKFTINVKNEEYQVHVFVLKLMDGIRVVPRRELADLGIVL